MTTQYQSTGQTPDGKPAIRPLLGHPPLSTNFMFYPNTEMTRP